MTKTKTLLNRAIKAQQQMKLNIDELNQRMPFTGGVKFKVVINVTDMTLQLKGVVLRNSAASDYFKKKGIPHDYFFFAGDLPDDIEKFLEMGDFERWDYAINNMRAVK